MAEASRFWTTTGTGDGPAGGYTAAQFAEFIRQTLMTDTLAEGVLKGIGNELAVTSASASVNIASGAGLVYGAFYANDAPVNISVTNTAASSRIDRIVLRANFSATTGDLPQTIRIKKSDGIAGTGSPPALVQSPTGIFEIPLATVTVSAGGGTITVTDARTFVKTPGTYGYLDDANIIAAAQLASDSVTTVKILDANVTANKLASSAVIEAKIATGAVTSGKIGANAVVSGKIAADAVTTAAILNGTVTSDKLVSSAVITAKIADGAVTSDKLLSSAVITAKIADEAVTNAKLGPGAVTASKIATTTVTGGSAGNIAPLTITADNIAASTITGAKIATGTITGGWNGTAATGNIALSTITSANIADNAIIEAKIATGAVTVNKIGAGAVTSAKIGQNQVFGGSTGNIASLTITADNIAANAVTNAKIIDDAITSAKIADSAVVTASIASGAISSDKLATSSVTSGKIFPGAVNGSALGDYAIRFGGRQGGDSNSWSTPGTTSYETVSLTYGNNVLMVSGSIQISLSSASSGTANVTFVDYATAGVAFASNPIVVTTSNGSPDYILDISAISTSGATIRATHKAGTSATTTITAWWICVGTTTI